MDDWVELFHVLYNCVVEPVGIGGGEREEENKKYEEESEMKV